MSLNDTLTTKQRKAIATMLTKPTTEAAAQAAGIAKRTLYRWLELPAFRDALKAAEGLAIDNAARRLAGGMDAALTTLSELTTGAESEAVKRAAAAEWINQTLKIQELRNLEERLTKIEKELKL